MPIYGKRFNKETKLTDKKQFEIQEANENYYWVTIIWSPVVGNFTFITGTYGNILHIFSVFISFGKQKFLEERGIFFTKN